MFPFLDEMDVRDKKLLVRVDYNVPVKKRDIADDHRMRAGLPTLKYALDNGAALILCSHRGKPKGRVEPELSLKPVAEHLEELLHRPVIMAPDCIGPEVRALAKDLRPGQVLMLENLRFHAQ
ncbi:MAG: phosphoglycerate kinase, partial [Thermodesulfobacteriota bacterium]|nr:phosphoglycerate kinase [Thermodesulfobacteriota bacterium]